MPAAFGTVLTISPTAGDIIVAELTSISGPSISMDTIDVSSHDSADRAREFVAGMIDGGEISVEGNLTAANSAASLLDLMASGEVCEDSSIAFPDPPDLTWEFDCLVTAVSTDAPYEGKISFSATLKLSGLPTLS